MPDSILNLKNGTAMERIDLFDRYFNGELSDEEKKRFKERLESDEEFASDFKIYSMTVAGICKEAEQDNTDFGAAMKQLSKEQLFEIIGRQSKPITREDLIRRLQTRKVNDDSRFTELSGAAALDNIDDDYYYEDNPEGASNSKDEANKKPSDSSLRRFTFIFFLIVILIVLISIIW